MPTKKRGRKWLQEKIGDDLRADETSLLLLPLQCHPREPKRSQNIFPIKQQSRKKLSQSMAVETSIIMKFHKVFDWQNISSSLLFFFFCKFTVTVMGEREWGKKFAVEKSLFRYFLNLILNRYVCWTKKRSMFPHCISTHLEGKDINVNDEMSDKLFTRLWGSVNLINFLSLSALKRLFLFFFSRPLSKSYEHWTLSACQEHIQGCGIIFFRVAIKSDDSDNLHIFRWNEIFARSLTWIDFFDELSEDFNWLTKKFQVYLISSFVMTSLTLLRK